MDIRFLGAAGTVTGSKYLLSEGDARVLVDCGLYQGYKQLRLRNWEPLPADPRTIGAVVLTHAHIDHSGYLPLLTRNGFRGTVFCTRPTRDLCAILLPDSGHLHEEEAEYANRHSFSKHRPALPLYSRADAERCLERFVPVDYGTEIALGSGLTASLLPSGHILGSAFIRVRWPDGSVCFSGDIGRPHDPVMRAPAAIDSVDYLVVESTYGDRLHDPVDPRLKLAEVINRTVARRGAIIIPAFAVGRTQTVLHYIHLLKQESLIPDLPVFLNSPMARDVTSLYWSYHDEHRLSEAQCAATARVAHVVNSVDESKALNLMRGPMIVIAGSGMATGGRVVHHLKTFAPDSRNTILFTGFQAGGTRGAAMLNGAATIRIHGEEIPVRAEVAIIDNLSAHADAAEILDWLNGFARPPRRTFITHGEPIAADALRQRIEHTRHWNCRVPAYLETYQLD